MPQYMVEPKSRRELRDLANAFRKAFGLENTLYIPIVELLDVLCFTLEGFNYEITPDNTFPPNIHGDTNIRTGLIRIKQSVYDGAVTGDGRDRMTIAHEVGHFLMLYTCGFQLQRNFDCKEIPAYMDPEWQAKCFAGEFMISRDLTIGMSSSEIIAACGVSKRAAQYQYRYRCRKRTARRKR